jgi:hypothetical protein
MAEIITLLGCRHLAAGWEKRYTSATKRRSIKKEMLPSIG